MTPDAEQRAAVPTATVLSVLGLLASCELAASARLAGDAVTAPAIEDRVELCRLGGVAAARLGRLTDHVAELGGDLTDVLRPFVDAYADFDARTPARTWWERLLKAYVGFGVEDDIARLLADGLAEPTRSVVLEVLDDDGHSALVVRRVVEETAVDPVLASRLALWGRRLVGEALGVAGRLVTEHPDVADVLERALPAGGGLPLQQRLFAALTAEHTRRMGRLGLTA